MTSFIRDVEQQFKNLDNDIDAHVAKVNALNKTPKGSIFERLEACKQRYEKLSSDLDNLAKLEKEYAQFFKKSLQHARDFHTESTCKSPAPASKLRTPSSAFRTPRQ